MNNEQINGGYILLSRKIIESEIFKKPPLYLKVWIYLLSTAQHKEYKGLKKGQLYTSIPDIQNACSYMVGYRRETPTKDQIFNILEWLRKRCECQCESNDSATMITTTKATQGMLVSIDKYCIYQNPNNYESNNESSNEKHTKAKREQRQTDNINKNDKNDKNITKEHKHFENDSLNNAFLNYIEHRKLLKSPMTEKAIELAIKKLQKIANNDTERIEIINTSIESGWKGLFEIKQQNEQKPSTNKFNRFPQRNYSEEDFKSMEQRLLERGT